MTAPDLDEVHRATAVPDASSASERYGTGTPLEKIANTGHLSRRRRRHPANVGPSHLPDPQPQPLLDVDCPRRQQNASLFLIPCAQSNPGRVGRANHTATLTGPIDAPRFLNLARVRAEVAPGWPCAAT
jgi:hypothetical protein